MSTPTNPFPVTIPSDSSYSFSAISYAAYFQRVNITIGGEVVAQFNGQGEGVSMETSNHEVTYEGATRQAITANLEFLYSTDGTNYNLSRVADVTEDPEMITIGTEDSNDNDYNDTLLTLNIGLL